MGIESHPTRLESPKTPLRERHISGKHRLIWHFVFSRG